MPLGRDRVDARNRPSGLWARRTGRGGPTRPGGRRRLDMGWTRGRPDDLSPQAGGDPDRSGGLPLPGWAGRVIYVGKAKSLRPRLSSYFQDITALHPRTATMVTSAACVEWTVVRTEVEALQLEYSWIKEFDPPSSTSSTATTSPTPSSP